MIGAFLSRREGNVALIFAFILLPLVGASGLAIDTARIELTRVRLVHAVDAAALAVANSSGTEAQLRTRLERFVAANYPEGRVGRAMSTQLVIRNNRIEVTARAVVDATFMRVFGYEEIDVEVTAEAIREVRGIEIAMVLDNTGSMLTNNNIGALRTASQSFVDILFNGRTSDPNLKIAIVPYSAAVNVGDIAPALVGTQLTDLNNALPAAQRFTYSQSNALGWKGCLSERDYPQDTFDRPLGQGTRPTWGIYRWPASADNPWGNPTPIDPTPARCNQNLMTGPNLGCPTPITTLTGTKSTLDSAISAMQAWCRGGTLGNVGFVWGWRVLSPEFPFEEGRDYDEPFWRKVIVMMTDGNNEIFRLPDNHPYITSPVTQPDGTHRTTTNPALTIPAGQITGETSNRRHTFITDFSAYGRGNEQRLGNGVDTITEMRVVVDARFSEACEAAKDLDITVYTIVFSNGSSVSNSTRNRYRNCATDPTKYFEAPTQATLRTAFDDIARELSNLRLTR